MTAPHRHDVLVIGGGPAGAAAGYWLAEAGHDVVRRREARRSPARRPAATGSRPGRSPSSGTWGSRTTIAAHHHRYDGLRAVAHGITLELPWPEHPVLPSHGYVVRRRDLDKLVAEHAAARGATLLPGHRGAPPDPARRPAGRRGGEGQGQRRGPRDPRPLRRDRRRVAVALRPGARHQPRQAPTRRAWPSAATSRARCTPTRGSSRRSTCATATATPCPATAGSSRAATGPSTSASACCPRSGAGKRRQHHAT